MARDVKIEDWTTPERLAELRGVAKLTLAEIATYIGISTTTLRRWRKQSEAIDEAIQQKVDVNERKKVQAAMYDACFDRKVTTITEKQVMDRNGKIHTLTEVKTTVIPADVRAQKFYLTNRYPARWKEKVTVEQERPEELASFIPVPERMTIPEEGEPDEPTDG
jgi:transcriptional regulator with XRE-family HTH domain